MMTGSGDVKTAGDPDRSFFSIRDLVASLIDKERAVSVSSAAGDEGNAGLPVIIPAEEFSIGVTGRPGTSGSPHSSSGEPA
jgi:hypothetical protein